MSRTLRLIAGFTACLLVPPGALAVQQPAPDTGVLPDYDIRQEMEARAPLRPEAQAAVARLGALGTGEVYARYSPITGAVRLLTSARGPIASPTGLPPADAARSFLRENADLFGLDSQALATLDLAREYSGHNESISHVTYEQIHRGLRVFGAEVRIHVDDSGRVVMASSSAAPLADASTTPRLDAVTAARRAAENLRPDLSWQPVVTGSSREANGRTVFSPGPWRTAPAAELVLFPTAAGTRLAWQVTLEPQGFPQSYLVLIDAGDGTLLYRRNLVNYAEGVGNVLQSDATMADDPRRPDEAPKGSGSGNCPPIDNLFARDLNSQFRDPATVLADTGRLEGNDTTAWKGNTGTYGAAGTDNGGVWEFLFVFNSSDFSETQLFFMNNFVHDFFYDLGFDEASGNFQEDNFGRGGVGGDSVNAHSRDPDGRNNATFATPADGSNPTMSMFLWDGEGCWSEDVDGDGSQDLDGTIDLDIVVHEFHHGVTHRLNTQFGGDEAGAMGEGGGDFFAYSVNDDTNLGEYAAPPSGIRNVNAKTYGDWTCLFGFFCQVHTNGEIWANTLWDLREIYRQDQVGGSQESGIHELHQTYVNGLKLSPANPTMLDMRDSMLQDDLNRHPNSGAPGGSDNYCRLWEGFAGRGMGVNAQDTNDTGQPDQVVEDFTVPAACEGPVEPPDGDPTDLTATAVSSSQIDLSWTDNSTNEDGFSIERCTGSGCTDFAEIAQVGANTTAYSDTGLPAETTHRYRVRGFNSAGNSNYSNEAEATTLADTGAPAAPSDLTGTSSSTGKGKNKVFTVDLSWQDNSDNEDVFVIERCTESGKGKNKACAFSELATVSADTTTYQDGGLSRGTYRYRVKARNTNGDSAYSNEIEMTLK